MTGEQIVKALECCSQKDKCFKCPYDLVCYDAEFKSILAKDALDLINRQKAEIERLKERNDELNALNKIASIEAIKEFWENLKTTSIQGFWDITSYVDVDDGDNLVKEMVGDSDA